MDNSNNIKTGTEKRKCKFNELSAKAKHPCFSHGRTDYEAKCMVCDRYIQVGNKGLLELDRHVATEVHKKNFHNYSSSGKIFNFFIPKFTKVEEKICAAEGVHAFHTVCHHLSYKSTDCSSKMYAHMFGDSEVAKKFGCARTKTESIINNVFSPHAVDVIMEEMSLLPYCGVSTDASNHGSIKMFPVLIQYFNWKNGGLQTKLIDLKSTKNETSETIARLLCDSLNKCNILNKCMAFSGDNANTNFGGIARKPGKNVFTNLKSALKNDNLIGIGCPAHILHNCLQHGCDTLKYDIESIVLKIYNFFPFLRYEQKT